MINYPIRVPVMIGNLVSYAVEKFAKDNNLDYDLWYHDEPLWLIRKETPTRLGKLLVKRLQISAFDTPQGSLLKVTPDVYVVPSDALREEKKTIDVGIRLEFSNKHFLSLNSIREASLKNYAEPELRKMLDRAWENVSKLASELDPSFI